ncbi:MAG: terpene cyclase/mutase family protein [Planctomycetes bacterium]|nr:terpene cyclase/mutase family protein [Planctomycetota bacterium]
MRCLAALALFALAVSFSGRSLAAETPAEPVPQYQFESITVATASADEPRAAALDVEKALKYLDQGALAWSGSRKCVSCHTNGMYMTVRPALSPTAGAPNPAIREFFVKTLKQKQEVAAETLAKGTAPEQVIYLATGLAEWDRHVSRELSAETAAALKLMLSIQREDGTWGAIDCWPPYESDSYHPATVAAMAIATAPGWLANLKDEDQLARVERLRQYLRTTKPPHDYGRVLLLWASTRLPGIVEDRAELLSTLSKHQREDGGWSIRTFAEPEQWGRGNRAEKLRGEPDFANPASDGHMTGLAIVVLREAGVPANDPRIERGIAWLKSQQRASGRWWTRSLNTDKSHYITYSGTAYPLWALQMCGQLPVQPTVKAASR